MSKDSIIEDILYGEEDEDEGKPTPKIRPHADEEEAAARWPKRSARKPAKKSECVDAEPDEEEEEKPVKRSTGGPVRTGSAETVRIHRKTRVAIEVGKAYTEAVYAELDAWVASTTLPALMEAYRPLYEATHGELFNLMKHSDDALWPAVIYTKEDLLNSMMRGIPVVPLAMRQAPVSKEVARLGSDAFLHNFKDGALRAKALESFNAKMKEEGIEPITASEGSKEKGFSMSHMDKLWGVTELTALTKKFSAALARLLGGKGSATGWEHLSQEVEKRLDERLNKRAPAKKAPVRSDGEPPFSSLTKRPAKTAKVDASYSVAESNGDMLYAAKNFLRQNGDGRIVVPRFSLALLETSANLHSVYTKLVAEAGSEYNENLLTGIYDALFRDREYGIMFVAFHPKEAYGKYNAEAITSDPTKRSVSVCLYDALADRDRPLVFSQESGARRISRAHAIRSMRAGRPVGTSGQALVRSTLDSTFANGHTVTCASTSLYRSVSGRNQLLGDGIRNMTQTSRESLDSETTHAVLEGTGSGAVTEKVLEEAGVSSALIKALQDSWGGIKEVAYSGAYGVLYFYSVYKNFPVASGVDFDLDYVHKFFNTQVAGSGQFSDSDDDSGAARPLGSRRSKREASEEFRALGSLMLTPEVLRKHWPEMHVPDNALGVCVSFRDFDMNAIPPTGFAFHAAVELAVGKLVRGFRYLTTPCVGLHPDSLVTAHALDNYLYEGGSDLERFRTKRGGAVYALPAYLGIRDADENMTQVSVEAREALPMKGASESNLAFFNGTIYEALNGDEILPAEEVRNNPKLFADIWNYRSEYTAYKRAELLRASGSYSRSKKATKLGLPHENDPWYGGSRYPAPVAVKGHPWSAEYDHDEVPNPVATAIWIYRAEQSASGHFKSLFIQDDYWPANNDFSFSLMVEKGAAGGYVTVNELQVVIQSTSNCESQEEQIISAAERLAREQATYRELLVKRREALQALRRGNRNALSFENSDFPGCSHVSIGASQWGTEWITVYYPEQYVDFNDLMVWDKGGDTDSARTSMLGVFDGENTDLGEMLRILAARPVRPADIERYENEVAGGLNPTALKTMLSGRVLSRDEEKAAQSKAMSSFRRYMGPLAIHLDLNEHTVLAIRSNVACLGTCPESALLNEGELPTMLSYADLFFRAKTQVALDGMERCLVEAYKSVKRKRPDLPGSSTLRSCLVTVDAEVWETFCSLVLKKSVDAGEVLLTSPSAGASLTPKEVMTHSAHISAIVQAAPHMRDCGTPCYGGYSDLRTLPTMSKSSIVEYVTRAVAFLSQATDSVTGLPNLVQNIQRQPPRNCATLQVVFPLARPSSSEESAKVLWGWENPTSDKLLYDPVLSASEDEGDDDDSGSDDEADDASYSF